MRITSRRKATITFLVLGVGLAGIGVVVFGTLQGIFAVSTVCPIAIAIYRDVVIMGKRAQAQIGKP